MLRTKEEKVALNNWVDPGLELKDVAALLDEDARQVAKWGIQDRSPFKWLAYLVEEVGELAEAIIEADCKGGDLNKKALDQIHKEAIQAATLARKIAKMSKGY